jgi:hypothetical protein
MTWAAFYTIVIGINAAVVALGVLRAYRRPEPQDE